MKPVIVEAPLPWNPRRCHASGRNEGTFVDLGNMMTIEGRVYLSALSVEECGRLFGMVSQDEYADTLARTEAAEQEAHEAREELREANLELDAINYIKARGYKPTKRPGPKAVAK